MERQRIGLSQRASGYIKQLQHAIAHFLPARGLPLQSEDGRVRWTDRLLAMVAILMTWQSAGTLHEAFGLSRVLAIGMYDSRRRPGKTLCGFIEALQEASDSLVEVISQTLRHRVRTLAGASWDWLGYVVMAVDGSRIDCPRTRANEIAFGCAGRKKTGPQQFLTTVFHLGTGLIWDWRKGPGTDLERSHLRQMISDLPRRTLLLMDAGYVGFDLLRELTLARCRFLIRAGANVTLLRKLGFSVREHEGIVYLWPELQRRGNPLILRLVKLRDNKGKTMTLLTNVKNALRLSDLQMAQLYRWRWRVEVHFRTLKQTMAKRKMLSDAPHKAQVELDWAMVGLWLLGLMAVEQQQGKDEAFRWSAAQALGVIRRAMSVPWRRPPAGGLRHLLSQACGDTYRRLCPKASRNYPHKKNQKGCTAARIRTATRTERLLAQELMRSKIPA